MFVYDSRKTSRKYHIGDTGGTLCKMENAPNCFRKINTFVEEAPKERAFCGICKHLKEGGKELADIKVSRNKKTNFYNTFEWKKLRYEYFLSHKERACMCCGSSGVTMHVDHIKPLKKYPELAFDINNLQLLCGSCNHGKGNWDETDWRNKT